ncbi:MAG: DUF3800 domain-containing protein [Clostridiales bacterium]|nr:DUF3800 domain-containing protein [Clostridiales bacterium]
MNIYVYSDESGVFDKVHNDIYVFGGLIVLGSDQKEKWSRMYASVEKSMRLRKKTGYGYELKASNITNAEKGKMYRSLNNCPKFSVTINERKVLDRIFQSKKDKQRYLDYAYKIAVKRAFESMIKEGLIVPDEVECIFFNIDEHTTATNGRYELEQALEQEFKNGTYNATYDLFYPPIFSSVSSVCVNYCNSAKNLLVRAADMVANRVYHLSINNDHKAIQSLPCMHHIYLP